MNYTHLEANGNNGAGIHHETIQAGPDTLMGDQLYGHPSMVEMKKLLDIKLGKVSIKEKDNKSVLELYRNLKRKFRK